MTANEDTPGKAPKTRRLRRLGVILGATVLVVGIGTVVLTYYAASVDGLLPDRIASPQVTTVFAADGKTQLAQLGTENRIAVPMNILPDVVRNALIAGEDPDFFKNSLRGSKLTREYIRLATQADLGAAREAVLARKLEDKYDRLTIMGFYLNSVEFGRGAVGAEKAALAYFGKSAKDLDVAEAALLGAIVHQPYDADGSVSPYDPASHAGPAQERWAYVLDNMVGAGWIAAEQRAQTHFPTVRAYAADEAAVEWGIRVKPGEGAGRAAGNIVNHVYEELTAQGIAAADLRTGGYRIYTTIDPQAQTLLEKAARPDLTGSELYGRKVVLDAHGNPEQDLEAAGVVLDQASGRVLAYYGGIDGTEIDLAGVNTRDGKRIGGHPPGATMRVYTLAAALTAGASLQSHWKAMPFKTDDAQLVDNDGVVNNGCKDYCTLEESLVKSYNVPFYWVARQLGPGTIVRLAYQAGIRCMWDARGAVVLSDGQVQDDRDRAPFDRQVGYGKYPVTVLDHAAGVATIANHGISNAPHFVQKVEQRDPLTGQYKVVANAGEHQQPKQVIRQDVAADVTYAMSRAAADRKWGDAVGGREVAAVGGVARVSATGNSDAWVVGFSAQITVAIWTGNAAGSTAVVDPLTLTTIAAGNAPFRIWSGFVSGYSAAMKLPKEKLAAPAHVGRDDFPLANGVAP